MPTELSLLIQLGAVGAFIWYSITSRKAEAATQAALTRVFQTLLENEQKERQARDKAWRELMGDDRAQREQIANRHEDYFDRIHELSQVIEKLATAMGNHDANAQERTQQVLGVLSELKHLVSAP